MSEQDLFMDGWTVADYGVLGYENVAQGVLVGRGSTGLWYWAPLRKRNTLPTEWFGPFETAYAASVGAIMRDEQPWTRTK